MEQHDETLLLETQSLASSYCMESPDARFYHAFLSPAHWQPARNRRTMHIEPSSASQSARGLRVGIAVSRYHEEITQKLREAARAAFLELGGTEDDLIEAEAPGAFELPVVAAALADRGQVEAIVALGCILQGETIHDQVIGHAAAHGLTHLALETRIPVAFGILTCATVEQATERAGGSKGNKGAEAMRAAIAAARAIRGIEPTRSRKRKPA
jgi:6,7-dimethyl-8-ribityllumazine synthase